jgi:DNA repair exonuclease SbcCD nuclease subunit
MKILHSADLHLDAPFTGRTEVQAKALKQTLLKVPGLLAELCRREDCDLVLLSGDLFDGPWTRDSFLALRNALEEMAVPVFISPGNHDFLSPTSPYLTERWPKNVHIFTHPELETLVIPTLDCRIYGAGYRSMDCPALLDDFRAEGTERWHIGILHGDPTQASSPYCPITANQVQESGLHYLALGHIHKTGSFRAGETLCAWPGCPMGRGFDELETKGALIVTLEDTVSTNFVPLDTIKFFDYETPPGIDPRTTLTSLLPALSDRNFYRVTFTGESPALDMESLQAAFSQFPNLELRDRTVPPLDIWGSASDDTLEGVYFRLLKDAITDSDAATQEILTLAARISRQILDGQEVSLP